MIGCALTVYNASTGAPTSLNAAATATSTTTATTATTATVVAAATSVTAPFTAAAATARPNALGGLFQKCTFIPKAWPRITGTLAPTDTIATIINSTTIAHTTQVIKNNSTVVSTVIPVPMTLSMTIFLVPLAPLAPYADVAVIVIKRSTAVTAVELAVEPAVAVALEFALEFVPTPAIVLVILIVLVVLVFHDSRPPTAIISLPHSPYLIVVSDSDVTYMAGGGSRQQAGPIRHWSIVNLSATNPPIVIL